MDFEQRSSTSASDFRGLDTDMTVISRPLVSACLLSYNHANLLEETIESVLRQTLQDFELIISDDCSRDNSWALLQKLAAKDSRIRLIRPAQNVGMAANANFAVAAARSEFVALLHHDDLCAPTLLEKWLCVMRPNERVGFVTNAYAKFGRRDVDYHDFADVTDGPTALQTLLFPRWGCPVRGTALVRKSCWEAVGGMRVEFGLLADVDLWMRLARNWDIGYVREPLITVRQDRPDDYPKEYVSWSWDRTRLLYEIHGTNRSEYYSGRPLRCRAELAWFRARVTKDELYWLAYAGVRRRLEMLTSSDRVANKYELFPARLARRVLSAAAALVS